jgi:hypothetical protein
MLRHPHVLGFFGVSLGESNHGTIVCEYCEGRCASRLVW